MKIIFVGAGRLATNLAIELSDNSFDIAQVYSRTEESAKCLADKINSSYTNVLTEIDKTADLYIFSVKDSVLSEIIKQFPPVSGLCVHTSGSVSMNVFDNHISRYGVIYPFQTFSKDRKIEFKKVPFFLESNNDNDLAVLHFLCERISDNVYDLSSAKRQYLHLTGVFACNFVNHMYAVSGKILGEEGIPFETLLPLIDETAAKVHVLSPQDAQTGPAVRYDENIINKHIELIDNPTLKTIYTLISESIHDFAKTSNQS